VSESAVLQDLGRFQQLVCERWLRKDGQRGLGGSAEELQRLCSSLSGSTARPRRFLEVMACCSAIARIAPLALDLGTLSNANGLFGGCEDAIKPRPRKRQRQRLVDGGLTRSTSG
jgi:hypothetical protein